MKAYLVVLLLFLFAFAGLAAGLLLKRKGLRGGCRPEPGSDLDCQCKSGKSLKNQSKGDCQSQGKGRFRS